MSVCNDGLMCRRIKTCLYIAIISMHLSLFIYIFLCTHVWFNVCFVRMCTPLLQALGNHGINILVLFLYFWNSGLVPYSFSYFFSNKGMPDTWKEQIVIMRNIMMVAAGVVLSIVALFTRRSTGSRSSSSISSTSNNKEH